MTDFPRGWTLSELATAGVTASITVPAIPGVVHVLDAFTASLNAQAAAAGAAGPDITLTSSDGTFTGFVLGQTVNPGGAVTSPTHPGRGWISPPAPAPHSRSLSRVRRPSTTTSSYSSRATTSSGLAAKRQPMISPLLPIVQEKIRSLYGPLSFPVCRDRGVR